MKKIRLVALLLTLATALTACAGSAAQDLALAPNTPVSEAPAPAPAPSAALSDSENPVLALIARSYSASTFTERAVDQEAVEQILLCGAKAPSAKNAQPWHFTVVRDGAGELLAQAKSGSVLIVVSGRLEDPTGTVPFDCGLATQNMQLAAEALGLGARIFLQPVQAAEKNRAALGIPEGYGVQAAILIGHVEGGADAVASATPRNPLSGMVNYAD